MPRARMRPEVKERLLATVGDGRLPTAALSGRQLVAEWVRQWIFDGQLRDGDVISQEDLAEILGVSRIPVRDGLISLEHGGWVAIDPGVGARAVGLAAADVRDSFDVLAEIWCLLIRRVVEQGADTTSLLSSADAVSRARTAARMTEANSAFVAALLRAAHAPRLDAAFRNAGRIVPGEFFATVPKAMDVQRAHVPHIAPAIADGDIAEASTLARSQHTTHARNIIAMLERRGVITPPATIPVETR